MNSKFFIAFMILSAASTLNIQAQENRGLRDENKSIREGVSSGKLTGRETARLNTQIRQLRREAICYKANDGHIGPRERADLRRDNSRLARNIYIQKHDRQGRF